MIDGTKRIEIENVEVLDASGLLVRCRCDHKVVLVPPCGSFRVRRFGTRATGAASCFRLTSRST